MAGKGLVVVVRQIGPKVTLVRFRRLVVQRIPNFPRRLGPLLGSLKVVPIVVLVVRFLVVIVLFPDQAKGTRLSSPVAGRCIQVAGALGTRLHR
jgi:hypothetical protein